MKDDFGSDDVLDGGTPRRSIVGTGPMMKPRLGKRESVPSMVFNGLKRRLSTKVGKLSLLLLLIPFQSVLPLILSTIKIDSLTKENVNFYIFIIYFSLNLFAFVIFLPSA